MALKCGLVIYNRPCREKNPRRYTKCDVARIARKAAEHTPKQDVMLSVAIALGYPIILNGAELKDDVEYAKDLKKGIDEYTSIKTPAEIAAVIAQGAIGLVRILITRTVVTLLTKRAEKFAIALAPAILLSLRKHIIIGIPCGK